MKVYFKKFVHALLAAFGGVCLLLTAGCAHLERPYTYYEFDGLFVFYKTQDTAAYRELLPDVFDMPDEPLMMAFVMDYYKMNKGTEPYREVAVSLLAKYKGKTGWHCLVMPVTTDDARVKGIKYLGFPKIMGDINLVREASTYTGTLKLNHQTVMTLELAAKEKDGVSLSEAQWFEKLWGLPNFNLLNGKIYEPDFGGKTNLLEVSRIYPDRIIVKTGSARILRDPQAAGAHSERLAKVFGVRPSEVVLAYYFKNTFPVSFGRGAFR
ncbi:MAG: acetoacetate decarboxylase family protein [Smithellaceae bacterium]